MLIGAVEINAARKGEATAAVGQRGKNLQVGGTRGAGQNINEAVGAGFEGVGVSGGMGGDDGPGEVRGGGAGGTG